MVTIKTISCEGKNIIKEITDVLKNELEDYLEKTEIRKISEEEKIEARKRIFEIALPLKKLDGLKNNNGYVFLKVLNDKILVFDYKMDSKLIELNYDLEGLTTLAHLGFNVVNDSKPRIALNFIDLTKELIKDSDKFNDIKDGEDFKFTFKKIESKDIKNIFRLYDEDGINFVNSKTNIDDELGEKLLEFMKEKVGPEFSCTEFLEYIKEK